MHHRTTHVRAAADALDRALQDLDRRDTEPGTPAALSAGHKAVRALDEALRSLYSARQLLVGELAAEQAATDARVDALLARHRGAAS